MRLVSMLIEYAQNPVHIYCVTWELSHSQIEREMPKVTKAVNKKRAPEGDSGPSMEPKQIKVGELEEDSEEFQEGQRIPDVDYQSPPAPAPMIHDIPEEKECLLM